MINPRKLAVLLGAWAGHLNLPTTACPRSPSSVRSPVTPVTESAHKLARQVCEEMVGLGEKELPASQLSSCVSS